MDRRHADWLFAETDSLSRPRHRSRPLASMYRQRTNNCPSHNPAVVGKKFHSDISVCNDWTYALVVIPAESQPSWCRGLWEGFMQQAVWMDKRKKRAAPAARVSCSGHWPTGAGGNFPLIRTSWALCTVWSISNTCIWNTYSKFTDVFFAFYMWNTVVMYVVGLFVFEVHSDILYFTKYKIGPYILYVGLWGKRSLFAYWCRA